MFTFHHIVLITLYHRTLLIGVGIIGGDWEKDNSSNKKVLYIIEPVVESLLQVRI